MRRLAYGTLAFAVIGSGAASAGDAPELPASAKKLSGLEIVRFYDGRTFRFESYAMKSPLTGSITHDLKANVQSGTYVMNGETGTFEGGGRVKGDKYCYESAARRQTCGWVYRDGETLYEVNGKGIVEMVKRPN